LKFVSFNLNSKGKVFWVGVSAEIDVWFMGIIEVIVSFMVGPLFEDQFQVKINMVAEKFKKELVFNPVLIPC
jgi:hypothetical protein